MDAVEKDYPNLTEMEAYASESHACGIGVDAAELTRVIAEVKTLRAANAAKDEALKAAAEYVDAVLGNDPTLNINNLRMVAKLKLDAAKVQP